MELCKLDAGLLLVDAHSRLLNAEQLSLMRGIPELGVLLLLLLARAGVQMDVLSKIWLTSTVNGT